MFITLTDHGQGVLCRFEIYRLDTVTQRRQVEQLMSHVTPESMLRVSVNPFRCQFLTTSASFDDDGAILLDHRRERKLFSC